MPGNVDVPPRPSFAKARRRRQLPRYRRERPDPIILAATSLVRTASTVGEATVEKGLVLQELGRLEEEDRRALRGVLDAILGQ